MRPLEGQLVALLESRKASDLATLVQRFGGKPQSVPSVREVLRADDFGPVLGQLRAGAFDVVVMLTAAACEALLAEAERSGALGEVVAALERSTLAVRGPKPVLALRRRGLAPTILTEKPHTTAELLTALAGVDVSHKAILVLHYGEQNEALSRELSDRGATVKDLCLYDWALPQDLAPLEALVRDAIAGRVDAMLFTSQIQFRHLLHVAHAMGLDDALTCALRDEVIVGSVGPVCSRVLRAHGIVPDVMPGSPNGSSLVQAVADYFLMFDDAKR